MVKNKTAVCGLCGHDFTSSDFIFLICKNCVSGNVELDSTQTYTDVVYGLYSMKNELLYIGVTNNPIYRAHNHMLTKNFKILRVVKYFNNRKDADNFERWSIWNIRPPLNRLIEKNWTEEPTEWNADDFGIVAKIKVIFIKTSRKSKKKKIKKIQNICPICKNIIGKNKGKIINGQEVHLNPCKPPLTSEEKEKLREETKRTKVQSKITKQKRPAKSKQAEVLSGIVCKYCKKPLEHGAHMPCRRKRLRELGRL